VFSSSLNSPPGGPGAQKPEYVGGDETAQQSVRSLAPGEIDALTPDDGDVLERVVASPPLLHIRYRHQQLLLLALSPPDDREPIGGREGKRAEQYRAHRAEDRGVRADREPKREDRHRGEARRLPQLPKGVAGVLA